MAYYDGDELHLAITGSYSNPYESKSKLGKYLQKYSADHVAYEYYVSILIMLGELDLAEKTLTNMEEMLRTYKVYKEDKIKAYKFEMQIIFYKIKLLAYQERYELILDLLNRIKGYKNIDLTEVELERFKFYCRKKLGMLNVEREDINIYFYAQVIEYRESQFLEHVRLRHIDNTDELEQNKALFYPEFPFLKILEEVKKYIPSDKKINCRLYDNTYFFRYDNCGMVGDVRANYFKVVCFNNTSQMITMYPFLDGAHLPCVDLNYFMVSDTKVKKLSQIDKFNQRYKRG